MNDVDFIGWVAERAGLTSAQAERAIRSTLEVLGERLSRSESSTLADELPTLLGDTLRRAGYDRAFDRDELERRVAVREGVTRGFAREHLQTVCGTIADHASPSTLSLLRRALPPGIGELFAPTERHAAPDPRPHVRTGTTLADARPGSRHPLSEAKADRAQADSVVTSANPHGDTKLSSAHGLTQEREHETIAEGHAGADRPLSSAH